MKRMGRCELSSVSIWSIVLENVGRYRARPLELLGEIISTRISRHAVDSSRYYIYPNDSSSHISRM